MIPSKSRKEYLWKLIYLLHGGMQLVAVQRPVGSSQFPYLTSYNMYTNHDERHVMGI